MALLGALIDSRTLATIQTQGSATFAHGLPAAPDFVLPIFEASGTASSASVPQLAVTSDASNVTVLNVGQVAGAGNDAIRVVSVSAHSVIR